MGWQFSIFRYCNQDLNDVSIFEAMILLLLLLYIFIVNVLCIRAIFDFQYVRMFTITCFLSQLSAIKCNTCKNVNAATQFHTFNIQHTPR